MMDWGAVYPGYCVKQYLSTLGHLPRWIGTVIVGMATHFHFPQFPPGVLVGLDLVQPGSMPRPRKSIGRSGKNAPPVRDTTTTNV